MRGFKRIIITVLALILCVLVSACSNRGGSDNTNTEANSGVTINCYYLEKTTFLLKSEKKSLDDSNDNALITSVMDSLKAVPVTEHYSSVVPEGVELKSFILKDGELTLNLSKEYNDLKSGEELLCRAAIVWTYTELEQVDSVSIKVNGEPLKKTNGDEIGPMTKDDVVIDKQVETQPTNSVTLSLYFGDQNATKLVKELRVVEVNPNQPLERYVVEQLIAGPVAKENIRTIPAETKIRDIKTADGICYLDLSAEFVNKHNGGSTGELMTVYSIVNSLCELDHIDSVQFLIEGEKQDEFKGHIEFSKPFAPNYDIEF